jgi:glycerophosphoryl diester phosphodiesterase
LLEDSSLAMPHPESASLPVAGHDSVRQTDAAALAPGVLAQSVLTPRVLTWLAVLSLAALGGFLSVINFGFAYDDAYITYRVAYNFAAGHGFVYNLGERVLVTTAPFYGLVLGALGWLLGPDRIPAISAVLSGLSFTLIGLGLYDYARLHGQPLVGWLAGYFLLTSPIFLDVFGGEMPFQLALGLWAFVCYARGWRAASAVLLALTALARPDGVLAAVVLFGYDAIRRRRIPWREGFIYAAVLLPFVLAAWVYFGSPLPMTLSAKIAQRDAGLWTTYGRGLRDWVAHYLLPGVRGPHLSFFALDPGTLSFWLTLGVPALLFYRVWWPPLAWLAFFVIWYRTMKVPFYHWYSAPAVMALSMVAACGVAGVVALARRIAARAKTSARVSPIVTGPVFAAIGVALAIYSTASWVQAAASSRFPLPGVPPYAEAGRWLREHTPADSTIAYYEIGHIGYYSQRYMIDPLGLLDPAVPPHVAQRDFLWAYERARPNYILEMTSAAAFNTFKQQPWFASDYRQIHVFPPPDQYVHDLIVWERMTTTPTGPAGQTGSASASAGAGAARKMLVAHRGASGYAPEHTLAAYRLALAQGADFVEQDLALTKDGALICLHDPTLERTTDVEELFPDRFVEEADARNGGARVKHWYANDFTLAEIKRLDAGRWFDAKFAGERIPTFQEAIDLVKAHPGAAGTAGAASASGNANNPGTGLFPELKDPELYRRRGTSIVPPVVAALKANGLDHPRSSRTPIILQSFDEETLRELTKTLPEVPRVFLVGGHGSVAEEAATGRWLASEATVREIAAFATGIGPAKALVTKNPPLVAWAHAAGLTVTPYTFRAANLSGYASVQEEMRYFLYTLGVDAVFTDNPDQFPREPAAAPVRSTP